MIPTKLEFDVPGSPVPKARARVSLRQGRDGQTKVHAHTPKRTASYESRVGLFARARRPRGWPTRAEYRVSFLAALDADRGDIDNFLKSILDGAQGVLWENDKSVRRLGECEVRVDTSAPGLHVTVEAFPVRCSRGGCGAETFYPDADGRCPNCPVQHRARRA